MERRINIRLMESDAKLLMQMCNMFTDNRYFGGFIPTSMGILASDICERLEGIFLPEEDVMVDLTKEGQ